MNKKVIFYFASVYAGMALSQSLLIHNNRQKMKNRM